MPLVAHPVRSLWGSQPRCARCVCEWLHRKWDGAVSNRPEGRNTFRCSTPMCSLSSGVLIRNSAGPTFIPSLMASSSRVLLRSGTIRAGMSRLVTLLIDAASSSPSLVWVAPLVSIGFGVAMLGSLLFLIMRSGSVVFSKFSSPCCLVRIYVA